MMGKQVGAGTLVADKSMTKVVPPGYKQTKVGVIPEEWKVVRLGDIVEYKKGYAFKSSDYQDSGIPIVRVSDTGFNVINDENMVYIDEGKAKEYKDFQIMSDDIIITTVGSRPPLYDSMVGKIILVPKKNEYNLLNQNAVKIFSKTAHNKYIFNQLSTKRYIQYIESIYRGNANQASITLEDLFFYKIPLPPLKEQQKIAQILTTWDDAISKQEALIEAKEQLKKGLMQKLLSGEVRFSGFDGEWEEVRLGNIGQFKTSSVNKIINQNEQIVNLINYMDVYKNKHIDRNFECSTTSIKKESFEKVSLKKGDILFTPSSETPSDIGHSSVIVEDLANTVYSYHLIRFRPKRKLDINFSGYVFNNISILKEFARRATGSTRFTLSIKDFNETKAKIPSLPEQQKIAQVLTIADKEIALLKEELEALKEQKRGLMQKLLTGEVRV